MYLRDGGFLAVMLSQLANMLAILWYPSAQGEVRGKTLCQFIAKHLIRLVFVKVFIC